MQLKILLLSLIVFSSNHSFGKKIRKPERSITIVSCSQGQGGIIFKYANRTIELSESDPDSRGNKVILFSKIADDNAINAFEKLFHLVS